MLCARQFGTACLILGAHWNVVWDGPFYECTNKTSRFFTVTQFLSAAGAALPECPGGAQSEAPVASAPTTLSGLVYIIPIRNMIEPALLYVVRRGVAEAQRNHADAIVFVMDTPGGTLDAAGKILRIIQDVDVPTYTFVEKDAYSAGAIIALATDEIYMAPGSVIGMPCRS